MDTGNDQDALLRGAERDVVREDSYGVFKVQLLEGPTDNPIRVLGPARLLADHQESYTFGIEGEGWNILVDILGLPGQPADPSTIPYHLSCLISLVRHFPSNFGLIEATGCV